MTPETRVIDSLEAQLLPAPSDSLRVALLIPQTGPLGMSGPSGLDAALLAAHEISTAGGVRGRCVELVLVDAGREPATVTREVDRLIEAGAVEVLAGFHTSDVHRAVEATLDGRLPYLFTPPQEGGRRRRGVLCMGVDPARQLRGPLRWLSEQHAAQRWALIGNDYIWPASVHRLAKAAIRENAGQVVLERRVPLGGVEPVLDHLLDALRLTRPDAVLLSLVGRDLVTFNRALARSGLDRRLVRLSGALEENGLMASGGDDSGLLYAAMPSFAALRDDRRLGLDERHRRLSGDDAPVLDTYAEGMYDGLHLIAALAAEGSLRVDRIGPAARRLLGDVGGTDGSAYPGLVDRSEPDQGRDLRSVRQIHLARAEGLEFVIVPQHKRLPFGNTCF